jgi:uncharacterized protein YndB with AHSA1/START domain
MLDVKGAIVTLRFQISGRIARPVDEVFEAVVDPDQLSKFFTTGGAKGRLEAGATVTWDFADFPGAFPVQVVEVEQGERIVLRWDAADSTTVPGEGMTTVTMSFEPLDGRRTLVTIAEEGWHPTEGGTTAAFENCEGWTNALCCMKAWLEHGINLRDGFYA